MWWRDAPTSGARAPRPAQPGRAFGRLRRTLPVFLMLLPLMAAGCGFQPLYGSHSFDPNMQQDLGSIDVLPLPDRQGQLVHNALLTALNPKGPSPHPRYHLSVNVSVAETQQALRTDDTATRNVMTFSTSYWLYEDKTRVLNGSFSQIFSYDFLEEHYANVSAAEDIRKRAAQSVADEIRNRMAAYFAKAAEVKAQAAASR